MLFIMCLKFRYYILAPRVVQWKRTALMLAIGKQNDAMVTALLDHNANLDIHDRVSKAEGPQ